MALATAVCTACALLLIQPKRRSIAQSLDVDATRQAPLHGSTDQLGSKKGGDGHLVFQTKAAVQFVAPK